MLINIHNKYVKLTVDTLGAQMMNLQTNDGTEYLWQGDPKYWGDRAPTLFPFIGRLTNNSYKFHGKVYPMGIHGFAAASQFVPVEQTEDKLVLLLSSNDETHLQYPFDFSLVVTYQLQDNSVAISYCVSNLSNDTMPFGIGGHPGFRVPLEDGESFDNYTLEFSQTCQPDLVGFTPEVYLNGCDKVYPLLDEKYLPLKHDLFNEDALILKNMAREVKLSSNISHRSVTVSYPDMPYLGIWHRPKTDAPYVCIEPWTSLPARQDIVEEISCKSDLVHLAPRKMFDTTWTIAIS